MYPIPIRVRLAAYLWLTLEDVCDVVDSSLLNVQLFHNEVDLDRLVRRVLDELYELLREDS